MKPLHEDTNYIQNITFAQIKNLTQQRIAQLDSFDRQFSGEVSA